jgi:HEAT repeat protein
MNRSILALMASGSYVLKATIRQLNNKDVRLRRRAVRKLFELDDPTAIDAFIPLLKDSDEWFRGKALMAIQRWASMKDLNLAEKLSNSKKPEERILACRIAPKVGKSSERILKKMLDDEDNLVKQNAWKNILNLNDDYIEEAIKSSDVGIRVLAVDKIQLMYKIDNDLIKKIFDDDSSRIRKKAINILKSKPELYSSGEFDDVIIKIAENDNNIQIDALIMLIESGERNELFIQKIPLWLENENSKMIKLVVESTENKDWGEIDWLINTIMSSSNDKLISRMLRRKKSIEADKYRKEILLDEDRNAVLRSRVIEDLFGKEQGKEITKIIHDLENNRNESISETAKMYRKSIS